MLTRVHVSVIKTGGNVYYMCNIYLSYIYQKDTRMNAVLVKIQISAQKVFVHLHTKNY